ncbi:hypothetical protein E4T56_gene18833 [Termitomyces sp. T112]|nr:hypothetical protein E4T56_gene18833 [Termitomyces sp. T112]
MADTACLFDSPPHPWKRRMKRDFSGRVSNPTSRTLKPVKYFLLDFGLSQTYRSEDAPFLKKPPWGGDKTVPEHLAPDASPCDPFAVDVYCLGNYLRQSFLDGWDGVHRSTPQGFEFMRELITDMVHKDPIKRPMMSEIKENPFKRKPKPVDVQPVLVVTWSHANLSSARPTPSPASPSRHSLAERRSGCLEAMHFPPKSALMLSCGDQQSRLRKDDRHGKK